MSGSRKRKGVFCLEIGEWEGTLRKPKSVEPALQLLSHAEDVPYIHRDVSTEAELLLYLRKWTQKGQAGYPILYLAFHGEPGMVLLHRPSGRLQKMPVEEILGRLTGKCSRRIIHFGGCRVLDQRHGHTINRYLRETGATAICGYNRDIDWFESAVLDVMLFAIMQEYSFTKRGAEAIRRKMRRKLGRLRSDLQFRMWVKK